MLSSPEFRHHRWRRTFLENSSLSLGAMALGCLSSQDDRTLQAATTGNALAGLPHFAPRAKRVVCLFQSGGLSHVDLFDDKPMLHEYAGKEIPPSVKGTQRLTGMTSSSLPIGCPTAGKRESGAVNTVRGSAICFPISDDCRRSVHHQEPQHEAINHDPAITFMNTGTAARIREHRRLG